MPHATGRSTAKAAPSRFDRVRHYIDQDLWRAEGPNWFRRLGLRTMRIGTLVVQGLDRTESFIRAAALT